MLKENIFHDQPIALDEVVERVATLSQPSQIRWIYFVEDVVDDLRREAQKIKRHPSQQLVKESVFVACEDIAFTLTQTLPLTGELGV